MAFLALSDQARMWQLSAAWLWRKAGGWIHAGPFARLTLSGPTPDRLLIAPQDIRTSDPTLAADYYAGRFAFLGQTVECGGRSPFEMPPPSEEWARTLHGFGWLRHLRASERALSQTNARALVDDWLKVIPRKHPIAWDSDVASRRLMSWLSQSPLILEDCNRGFYRRFMRAIARHISFLRRAIEQSPSGMPRMRIALALSSASVSIAGSNRFMRQCARRLDAELAAQILPDGGHVSRNPAAIIEILADILPIRQALNARGIAPSQTMMNAVDRMMPMLRFFRHGDGTFAHFNGMGFTPSDLVATILAYDDARGAPANNAGHSGYQRLTAGRTLVIADTGPPPPAELSGQAHAGCLSFEMSSGTNLLIVNCGVPARNNEEWHRVARSTAAHSVAVLNDTSSCRFLSSSLTKVFGRPIVAGPNRVAVSRRDDNGLVNVTASHDGYQRRFHVVHERSFMLSGEGGTLIGIDRFSTGGRALKKGEDEVAIRFHLHPDVRANSTGGGTGALLICPDGEVWDFDVHSHEPGDDEAMALEVLIEESVYLADPHGFRRNEQIVVYGRLSDITTVTWTLTRQPPAASAQRTSGETPELPL
ncbi:MAG: heparinase [Hyphomicrobiales bacterium]|nr:MAG: heparinase [Hyphomicrobiales bacterium]